MAWSDLSSNRMVTFYNASSSGLPLKSGQSHSSSNQLVTKSAALAKYNLDAGQFSAYASNQLVPKSKWVSASGNFDANFNLSNAAGSGSTLNVYIEVNGSELINESLSDGQSFWLSMEIASGAFIVYEIYGTAPIAIYSDTWAYDYTNGVAVEDVSFYDLEGGVYYTGDFVMPSGSTDISINLDPYT